MMGSDFFEESIYNIIPPKVIHPPKPPMHRSSLPPVPTGSTFGHATSTMPMVTNLAGDAGQIKLKKTPSHRTFGKSPGAYLPDPNSYLKMNKSNSVPTLATIKKERPELLHPLNPKPRKMPPVPRRDDLPIMNLVTSKNFIVANAVETILAAPKKTAQGAKDYLHKEDYGKVPRYLEHIKSDIQAEYDYIRQLQEQEAMQNDTSRLLPEEDKQALIMGLKAKWEATNSEYQKGTHMTKLDTMGKIRRKETCEAQLSQIEKDIEKLNKRAIYVDTLC